jgi:hypothetical protein
MEQDKMYISPKTPNLKYICAVCFSDHYIRPQTSDWSEWPQIWLQINLPKPNILGIILQIQCTASILWKLRWGLLSLSGENSCQTKSDIFHGKDGRSFFSKAAFEKFGPHFSELKDSHMVLVSKTWNSFTHTPDTGRRNVLYTQKKKSSLSNSREISAPSFGFSPSNRNGSRGSDFNHVLLTLRDYVWAIYGRGETAKVCVGLGMTNLV